MNTEEFRKYGHRLVDWMAQYMDQVEGYPVKSQVAPKEIYDQLPAQAPEYGEDMGAILKDFEQIIMPGVTHWQSPNFLAYFPANASPPSILAEMLMSTLAVQCMKWDTSPAAAELEERVVHWLRDAMRIPSSWTGVIQDTASTASLAAMICARERVTQYGINERGFEGHHRLRVYCSDQTHSSIEKGAKIAGFGKQNVIKIPTDDLLRMNSALLQQQIQADIEAGYVPCCVVAALGTTGTTAIDPLSEIADICTEMDVWLHIDAAYAGPLLLLDEYQWMIDGLDQADSLVFNPHKWLFTNFDCTVYFVKDPEALKNTFSILPEYLRTKTDGQVNNYCDWGVPLGRRFRALKLWFVIRSYGLEGIRVKLRLHNEIATWFERQVIETEHFELLAPRSMNLVCFHYRPSGSHDKEVINQLNEEVMHRLNDSGQLYFTHTKVDGWFTLRVVFGQTNVTMEHARRAWELIRGEFSQSYRSID